MLPAVPGGKARIQLHISDVREEAFPGRQSELNSDSVRFPVLIRRHRRCGQCAALGIRTPGPGRGIHTGPGGQTRRLARREREAGEQERRQATRRTGGTACPLRGAGRGLGPRRPIQDTWGDRILCPAGATGFGRGPSTQLRYAPTGWCLSARLPFWQVQEL